MGIRANDFMKRYNIVWGEGKKMEAIMIKEDKNGAFVKYKDLKKGDKNINKSKPKNSIKK